MHGVPSEPQQPQPAPGTRTALIVGSTGIVGGNLAAHLVARGWQVFGLARKPAAAPGITPVAADLQDAASVKAALQGIAPTHVFLCTWLRQPTEVENVKVNGAMTRNLFAALDGVRSLEHATLVTGTKHYLGPFESYGQSAAETPFREDTPRLPGLKLLLHAGRHPLRGRPARRIHLGVHRPHSIIGYALGNAMNMGVTLSVYASICRETRQPFIFPGSQFQWNALTDVTDAGLLATHLEWSATVPQARNQAFNTVNGDIFRWRWLWPQLAAYFGVEPQGPPDTPRTLAQQDAALAAAWRKIAQQHALVEPDVEKLASWWHTDADLGRELECVNDMTKSRKLGFQGFQETRASFFELFDRLRREKIIPA